MAQTNTFLNVSSSYWFKFSFVAADVDELAATLDMSDGGGSIEDYSNWEPPTRSSASAAAAVASASSSSSLRIPSSSSPGFQLSRLVSLPKFTSPVQSLAAASRRADSLDELPEEDEDDDDNIRSSHRQTEPIGRNAFNTGVRRLKKMG